MNDKNLTEIKNRFVTKYEVQCLDLEMLKILRYVPNSFSRIFGLAGEIYTCNSNHLALEAILRRK